MTVFDLILMRYLLHYGPILVKKCRVIFCIMRYAIFSLRYTFFKVIMQRTNTRLSQNANLVDTCNWNIAFLQTGERKSVICRIKTHRFL
jgi:hypothetical protein